MADRKAALALVIATIVTLALLHIKLTPKESFQKQVAPGSRSLKVNDPYYQQYISTRTTPSFVEWQQQHGKAYANEEERLFRMQVYTRNLRQIVQHNTLYESGKSTFFKGMNKFGDITREQFIQMFHWKQEGGVDITKDCNGSIMDAPNPPAELDWGNKVSEVRDQGTCGKDWAMVAAQAVESLYALKIGSLPYLSTQQLVECSIPYGNEGCQGGFMDQAFAYIIDEGIALDKSYPVREPLKCKYVLNMKFTTIGKCARIPSRSYSKLLSAIVQQPVSVALDFNPDMQLYKSGIYTGKCTSSLNHGMLLVGYGGKQPDEYYWRLKNTVGPTWGSGGFINLKRTESDGDGACGMQLWPSVPQGII